MAPVNGSTWPPVVFKLGSNLASIRFIQHLQIDTLLDFDFCSFVGFPAAYVFVESQPGVIFFPIPDHWLRHGICFSYLRHCQAAANNEILQIFQSDAQPFDRRFLQRDFCCSGCVSIFWRKNDLKSYSKQHGVSWIFRKWIECSNTPKDDSFWNWGLVR